MSEHNHSWSTHAGSPPPPPGEGGETSVTQPDDESRLIWDMIEEFRVFRREGGAKPDFARYMDSQLHGRVAWVAAALWVRLDASPSATTASLIESLRKLRPEHANEIDVASACLNAGGNDTDDQFLDALAGTVGSLVIPASSAAQLDEIRPGTVLRGRFLLHGDILSSSKEYLVCTGVDLQKKWPVAIKVVRPGHPRDATLREGLEREAGALAALAGANVTDVVTAVDQGVDTSTVPPIAYLVTRFDHSPLLEMYWDGWTMGRRIKFVSRIADLTNRVHLAGIVHGDIAARNTLVVEPGKNERPVFLDFGKAVRRNVDAPEDPLSRPKPPDPSGNPVTPVSVPLCPAQDIAALGHLLLEAVGLGSEHLQSAWWWAHPRWPWVRIARLATSPDPARQFASADAFAKAVRFNLNVRAWAPRIVAILVLAVLAAIFGRMRAQNNDLSHAVSDLKSELDHSLAHTRLLDETIASVRDSLATDDNDPYRSRATMLNEVPETQTACGRPAVVCLARTVRQTVHTLWIRILGDPPASLNASMAIPREVSPRLGTDDHARVVGATLGQLRQDEPGMELAVLQRHSLYYPARLLIYSLDRRFPTQPLNEVWNAGHLLDLCVAPRRDSLLLLATGNRLAANTPPSSTGPTSWNQALTLGSRVSRFPCAIVEISRSEFERHQRGTLFPIPPTEAWPSIHAERLLVQPPLPLLPREGEVASIIPDALEPPPENDPLALCRLIVSFQITRLDGGRRHYAVTTVYPDGSLAGGWQALDFKIPSSELGGALFDHLDAVDANRAAEALALLKRLGDDRHAPSIVAHMVDGAGDISPETRTCAKNICAARESHPDWLAITLTNALVDPTSDVHELETLTTAFAGSLPTDADPPYRAMEGDLRAMLAVRRGDTGALQAIQERLSSQLDLESALLLRAFEILALIPADSRAAEERFAKLQAEVDARPRDGPGSLSQLLGECRTRLARPR